MTPNPRFLVPLAAFLFGAAATFPAGAQTWNYKSFKKTSTGAWDKNDFVAGTISVEEKDGKPMFTLSAGRTDICYRGALPATVTKTDELTIVEVAQPMSGCEQAFRYLIRNDGSGGVKETKVGERWVASKFDFDLTPKK